MTREGGKKEGREGAIGNAVRIDEVREGGRDR